MQNKIIGNHGKANGEATTDENVLCKKIHTHTHTHTPKSSLLSFVHLLLHDTTTYLVNSVLINSLLLVETSQSSIVTLVQSPALGHRNPELISLLQSQEQGLDSSLQDRRVSSIELQTFSLDQSSAFTSLLNT